MVKKSKARAAMTSKSKTTVIKFKGVQNDWNTLFAKASSYVKSKFTDANLKYVESVQIFADKIEVNTVEYT